MGFQHLRKCLPKTQVNQELLRSEQQSLSPQKWPGQSKRGERDPELRRMPGFHESFFSFQLVNWYAGDGDASSLDIVFQKLQGLSAPNHRKKWAPPPEFTHAKQCYDGPGNPNHTERSHPVSGLVWPGDPLQVMAILAAQNCKKHHPNFTTNGWYKPLKYGWLIIALPTSMIIVKH